MTFKFNCQILVLDHNFIIFMVMKCNNYTLQCRILSLSLSIFFILFWFWSLSGIKINKLQQIDEVFHILSMSVMRSNVLHDQFSIDLKLSRHTHQIVWSRYNLQCTTLSVVIKITLCVFISLGLMFEYHWHSSQIFSSLVHGSESKVIIIWPMCCYKIKISMHAHIIFQWK